MSLPTKYSRVYGLFKPEEPSFTVKSGKSLFVRQLAYWYRPDDTVQSRLGPPRRPLELTVNITNPSPKLRKTSTSLPLIQCPDTIGLGDGDGDPLADPDPKDPSKFALPDAGECGSRRATMPGQRAPKCGQSRGLW